MGRKGNTVKVKKRRRRPESQPRRAKKRVCHFCREGITQVDWKDVTLLRKYMSDRAKIRARRVTGNCPRHQRQVATAIKNAREMALLPYVSVK
ncbi:MAG: 30S ribosomal protein S18 1 [Acidimicrobiia bacterium]|nr:MAG: 30S ribosomal protein S18 1 [Acidimicrobiia bacterium]